MAYDIAAVRADFPIFHRRINGQPLAYLDSAASAQKPRQVIDAEADFYRNGYAAVHRGIHTLSAEATTQMEQVRAEVAHFINAGSAEEIVFVRGTTEGINLVANSWGDAHVAAGDNIIISELEHHANIIPWQLLCQRAGAELRVIPLLAEGSLDFAVLERLIDSRTRLVAIAHISNVLGCVTPIKQICALAHRVGARVLVDGAQGIVHEPVDVSALGCDFYLFSGHKIYGPTGIGVLYGRREVLEAMPPWQVGGSMIDSVSLTNGTTWARPPWRFEAGTPHTAGIIGLGAALNWFKDNNPQAIADWEQALMDYAREQLAAVPDITLYGPVSRKGVIAFNLGTHHAYDVGCFLDNYGIAVRTGHHCAMPLMAHYGVAAMCRVSFGAYSTPQEIERLAAGLIRIHRLLG